MKFKNAEAEKEWQMHVEKNKDPYGKACVDVARRVMEILDEGEDFHPHEIICRADEEVKAGGITGAMAAGVMCMVVRCHERGDEFWKKWQEWLDSL